MSLTDNFIIVSMLWRAGEYGYFWHKADKHTTWVHFGDAWPIPQDGEDWYWGVHPTTCIPITNTAGEPKPPAGVRAQIPFVAAVNCLYAEFDAKDFAGNKTLCRAYIDNKLFAVPSVIVDSGGGYHCYYYLSEPVILDATTRPQMDSLQKRFVVMTGSDEGAKDLCRVLRIPGTFNSKYSPARMVEIVGGDNTQWDLADLRALIEIHMPIQPENPITPTNTNTSGGVGGVVKFTEGAPVGQRNRSLYWAACRLYDKGNTQSQVESELTPAALKAGLTEHEIRATIKSAQGRKPL